MTGNQIFLVEDNPNDVLLTQRALKKGHVMNELVVARDGVEALDYFFGTGNFLGRDLTLMPDVILVDLKMPKVDGLEVLRRIRANDRTNLLPVVILTTSKEEQDIITSYNLGANSYICKPVNFDQFVIAIQQLGLYWLVLNQAPPIRRKAIE